jgi:hypothetical protein
MEKAKNPVILSVIHRRQNSLESIIISHTRNTLQYLVPGCDAVYSGLSFPGLTASYPKRVSVQREAYNYN